MAMHVIFGAGSVGSATALQLVDAGHDVRIVTRSGGGPEGVAIQRVRADVSDPAEAVRASAGADVIYNCVNPASYASWVEVWPPMAAGFLRAAEAAGAVLVMMSNLYGYGPLDHPMSEGDPLATTETKGRIRATMWADALALHQAGRIRATEARASDYYGPGLTDTSHLSMVAPNVLSGKTAFVQGDPDQPHSWTYVDDVARTLAMIGTDSRAWGRAWNVPSPAPMTQRQAIEAMARIAGVKTPRILGSGRWLFEVAGLFSGQWRELGKVHYQWDRPFILDSSAATATFGIEATPMQEGLEATMAWWQARVAA